MISSDDPKDSVREPRPHASGRGGVWDVTSAKAPSETAPARHRVVIEKSPRNGWDKTTLEA